MSSVVSVAEVEVRGLQVFSVHRIEPSTALSRAFPSSCVVRLPTAPTEPYESAGGDKEATRPRKRRRRDAPAPQTVSSELGITIFSGRAVPDPSVVEPTGFNKGAADEREHHAKVAPLVQQALIELSRAEMRAGGFRGGEDAQVEWVQPLKSSVDWASMTRVSESDGLAVEAYNRGPRAREVSVDGNKVCLSARSGFRLATMDKFVEAAAQGKAGLGIGHFDVVVIDPPWENASAQRSSSYDSIELYDLFKIDLPKTLGSNDDRPALVAVWVTNRPKFRRFLRDKFLPDSKVAGPYAEWYWVKVTGSVSGAVGEPVFDLDSESPRRCYEGLVIGWYRGTTVAQKLPILSPLTMFVSPPLGHSRKPDIFDLLAPFLPSAPNVLELFARTVGHVPRAPGTWLSLGNEACKFNGPPWLESCTL